ncbi:MAG: hypothetical protein MUE36_09680 [Acidimicrobiales bacterium]|nr:hypothetical protein [Acidimicrobiales bacterium]
MSGGAKEPLSEEAQRLEEQIRGTVTELTDLGGEAKPPVQPPRWGCALSPAVLAVAVALLVAFFVIIGVIFQLQRSDDAPSESAGTVDEASENVDAPVPSGDAVDQARAECLVGDALSVTTGPVESATFRDETFSTADVTVTNTSSDPVYVRSQGSGSDAGGPTGWSQGAELVGPGGSISGSFTARVVGGTTTWDFSFIRVAPFKATDGCLVVMTSDDDGAAVAGSVIEIPNPLGLGPA